MTYQRQLIWCGKDCRGCPHGPYWYAFWRERAASSIRPAEYARGEGSPGRVKSKYVGLELRPEKFGRGFPPATSKNTNDTIVVTRRPGRAKKKRT